jgi:tetratricopeptide (TPR) repeat protein
MGAVGALGLAAGLGLQDEAAELEALLAEEREEADLLRRRGKIGDALRILKEHLRDEPSDAASRVLRGACRLDLCEWVAAEKDLRRGLEDCAEGLRGLETRRAGTRVLGELLLRLGRADEALVVVGDAEAGMSPATDGQDAWILYRVLLANGQRESAGRILRSGAESSKGQGWQGLLGRARCEQALGKLEAANKTLLEAEALAKRGDGNEAEVCVALGDLFFEAYREVADAAISAEARYRDGLELCAGNERALLGLFGLRRVNWKKSREPAGAVMAKALEQHGDSVEVLLAACRYDLEDGKLPNVRARLKGLEKLAGGRREVVTLRAALAWVEHRREECEELLAGLAVSDPGDGRPEREVGRHLVELYRFAEGVPFLERAVARDATDYLAWTQLGRARSNSGDEEGGLEALLEAQRAAGLRQDAWRRNMSLVLQRMERELSLSEHGDLSFAWASDAAPVFEVYLVPFYVEAHEELSVRYGFTPPPVRIEVFRELGDFSVRSTGFEGFPALGVCFGPVVTSVSPLSAMRGHFSWARTAFHEFTHVVHLGLSSNRCPRWITEGIATWEEVNRDASWTRNLRRELVDARANGELIPVRDLNRAFRGPRILFGYYQGGLLVEMLVRDHGFQSMVRILDAFNRGRDLDGAFEEVFGATPEEVDRRFRVFVDEEIAGLEIEPRWTARTLTRLRLETPRVAPGAGVGRAAWQAAVTTRAWGAWQAGRRVDAEDSLRRLRDAGLAGPRAEFLLGEMALMDGDPREALRAWRRGLEAGGEDFRVRAAMARLLAGFGEDEEALEHLAVAEEVFPGFADAGLSAELAVAKIHAEAGREAEAMAARGRWLAWDAGVFEGRLEIAEWCAGEGEWEEAAEWLRQANEVDPFSRELHLEWGEALVELGEWELALREWEVALLVPEELDVLWPAGVTSGERARALAGQARALLELGREQEARDRAAEALGYEAGNEVAEWVMEALGG